jgi:hypothetical protein
MVLDEDGAIVASDRLLTTTNNMIYSATLDLGNVWKSPDEVDRGSEGLQVIRRYWLRVFDDDQNVLQKKLPLQVVAPIKATAMYYPNTEAPLPVGQNITVVAQLVALSTPTHQDTITATNILSQFNGAVNIQTDDGSINLPMQLREDSLYLEQPYTVTSATTYKIKAVLTDKNTGITLTTSEATISAKLPSPMQTP